MMNSCLTHHYHCSAAHTIRILHNNAVWRSIAIVVPVVVNARKIWSLCIGRGIQVWNTLRVELERIHRNPVVKQC